MASVMLPVDGGGGANYDVSSPIQRTGSNYVSARRYDGSPAAAAPADAAPPYVRPPPPVVADTASF